MKRSSAAFRLQIAVTEFREKNIVIETERKRKKTVWTHPIELRAQSAAKHRNKCFSWISVSTNIVIEFYVFFLFACTQIEQNEKRIEINTLTKLHTHSNRNRFGMIILFLIFVRSSLIFRWSHFLFLSPVVSFQCFKCSIKLTHSRRKLPIDLYTSIHRRIRTCLVKLSYLIGCCNCCCCFFSVCDVLQNDYVRNDDLKALTIDTECDQLCLLCFRLQPL